MNVAAISHESIWRFRQPLARNVVRFRILTARDDISECKLLCWKRTLPKERIAASMTVYAQDDAKAQWVAEVTFPEEAHYIKYLFWLKDTQGNECYYCEHGLCNAEPHTGFFELLQVNPGDVLMPPAWAMGTVYYQIFPERFARGSMQPKSHLLESWTAAPTRDNYLGGDLQGITGKLPYLQALGIECLYMTPVFLADFNHKYATTDYFLIDPDFGTQADLVSLVAKAHSLGLRVVLDGVFNHTGIHFAPFADLVANGAHSRYVNWFYPKRFPIEIDAACYECVGDYPYMPRLNTANPDVQAFILSVMRYWLEHAHIDGWRLDVADELDASLVRYVRTQLKAEHPQALLLGETWSDATQMLCPANPFDCTMNYLFRDAMVDYFAHDAINEHELECRLGHMLIKYPPENMLCMYNCLSSHDTARFLTEAGGALWRAKLAIAFELLFVGSPALYYGEELGMIGENDPGCRAGMAWQSVNNELYRWVKSLLALRRKHEALRLGTYRPLLTQRKLFAFERATAQSRIVAVFNTGDAPQDFTAAAKTVTVAPHAVKIIL